MKEITDNDRLKCVESELARRRSVYPQQIDKAMMTWPEAEREIKTMESIRNILMNLKRISDKFAEEDREFLR